MVTLPYFYAARYFNQKSGSFKNICKKLKCFPLMLFSLLCAFMLFSFVSQAHAIPKHILPQIFQREWKRKRLGKLWKTFHISQKLCSKISRWRTSTRSTSVHFLDHKLWNKYIQWKLYGKKIRIICNKKSINCIRKNLI